MTDTDPKGRVAALFSEVAARYDEEVAFFAPFGRALVAAADLDPGVRVLDLAPGRGAVLYPALEAVGSRGSVLGIDLAPGMVEQLRRDLRERGIRNAEVRVGDAEDLDLPDGWFDAVTGGFMIFFPPQPERVLREVRRVLRPGGTVALSIFDCTPGFPFEEELNDAVGARPRERGPQSAYNRGPVLDEGLRAAGFRDLVATDVRERITFESAEHVERWQRSTGARTLYLSLDRDGLIDRYRELLAERLESHRAPSGDGFELVQRARLTVARSPG